MIVYEPIFAMPSLVCGTCRMALQQMRPVSLKGEVMVRYPCDSCKGQGDVLVKVDVAEIVSPLPQNSSPREG